ncbi:MAG: hypothetical protein WBE93_27915, partial [Pseudolabrys sp.]
GGNQLWCCNMKRWPMSALGHKRTFAVQNVMSALNPKADVCSATRQVRFVPIADISRVWICSGGEGSEKTRCVTKKMAAPRAKTLPVVD